MNISYKWLRQYVDLPLTPQQTADALTSTGLEVDSLEEIPVIRGGLRGLYVGHVLTCEPHPNSDHLHVTTVDLGREEPQQIVCGAPNVAAGQYVIVADLGCTLYDGDREFVIKKSKLRGVESLGMICAEDEIGIGTSHDGIIVLPDTPAPGTPAAEYYHLESDWLIEIDITANRSDALSHYGVARDLYAWLRQRGYETSLHRPDCGEFSVDDESLPIDVRIEQPEACPRYACISVSDCHVAESPKWLQERLTSVGLRPINNIVDITNYVMMAYGQPMHCFDADMVAGHRIVVRTEPEGTPFVTLDGVTHTLSGRDLCICNAQEPMCIAGVFGGRGSGTYPTTRNIVLESAYFHPTWIRKSARRHGLSTDASYRFERGADPNAAIYALKQAAILCRQLAGGRISMQIRDEYPQPIQPRQVRLDYEYCHRLIGKEIPHDTLRAIAESLEMGVEQADDRGLTLTIPTYRTDVTRPCDVVEDILRIYGYDNVEIPTALRSSLQIESPEDKEYQLAVRESERLVGAGFREILCNSLTRTAYYDAEELNAYPAAASVRVMNPLSADLGVMRQTMLFGGLETIARNINHKQPDLKLFEWGNCYHFSRERWQQDHPARGYSEEKHLALWLTGHHVQGSWAHPDENTSYYQLRAYADALLHTVGLAPAEARWAKTDNNIFSAALALTTRAGRTLAEVGIVSPRLLANMRIDQPVYYADIHWAALVKTVSGRRTEYAEISKYPTVSRDLALLLDSSVDFAQIEEVARQTERKLLRSVTLFDVYEGKNLPAGKKSYAVNFRLADDTRTMSDTQVDAVMKKLITNLTKKLGAELR